MWPQDEYIDPVFWKEALGEHLEIGFKSEEPVTKLCLRSEFCLSFFPMSLLE